MNDVINTITIDNETISHINNSGKGFTLNYTIPYTSLNNLIIPDKSGTLLLDTDTSTIATKSWANQTFQPIGSYLTSVPTLQEVTDAGNTTNNDITIGNLFLNGDAISTIGGSLNLVLSNSSFIIKSDTDIVQNSPILRFKHTAQRSFTLPNKSGTIILDTDTSSMLSPYLPSNVAAATYQPIGSYLTTATLTDSLPNAVSSITLNTPNVVFTTPVTFNKTGRAWSGTLSLNNQSPYTVFRRASGTGTPSFGTIDSSYWNGTFAPQVQAAQTKTVQWTGGDTLFAYNQARNGRHFNADLDWVSTGGQPFGSGDAIMLFVTTASSGTFTSFASSGVNGITLSTASSVGSDTRLFYGTSSVYRNLSWVSSDPCVFSFRVRIPTAFDGTDRGGIQVGLVS